jgi:hypothetical protein
MRDPPLCSRYDLGAVSAPPNPMHPPVPRYTVDHLADMHEAMDVEAEYGRRFKAAEEAKEND